MIGSLGGIEIVEAGRRQQGHVLRRRGARMWMEETTGKKVNDERSQELIATGASRIAVACPFCYIMIDDGTKAAGKEDDEVKVADISMHLLEALEAATPSASSHGTTDRRRKASEIPYLSRIGGFAPSTSPPTFPPGTDGGVGVDAERHPADGDVDPVPSARARRVGCHRRDGAVEPVGGHHDGHPEGLRAATVSPARGSGWSPRPAAA